MKKWITIALMLCACLAMGQDFFRRRSPVAVAGGAPPQTYWTDPYFAQRTIDIDMQTVLWTNRIWVDTVASHNFTNFNSGVIKTNIATYLGRDKYAVYCDGVDDQIGADTLTQLYITNVNCTVSQWFYLYEPTGSDAPFGSINPEYDMLYDTTNLAVRVAAGSGGKFTNVATYANFASNWHCVTIVSTNGIGANARHQIFWDDVWMYTNRQYDVAVYVLDGNQDLRIGGSRTGGSDTRMMCAQWIVWATNFSASDVTNWVRYSNPTNNSVAGWGGF